jgi:anti-sigma regulatory factor (Ser/Thr protein kinase)
MDLKRDFIVRIPVYDNSEIGKCRRKAIELSKKIGFDNGTAEEIAIIVMEMVSNIIKHGGESGYLIICQISDMKNNTGIEIWSSDSGEGISNIQQVIKNGYSSKDSLGIGLGSIQRFSDHFEINVSEYPRSLHHKVPIPYSKKNLICSRKWLPKIKRMESNKHIIIGVASRAKPGETCNGDNYVICHLSREKTLVAIIDGLGHGLEAHKVSLLAKKYISLRHDSPLPDIIGYLHHSLRGTRGATLGMALLDSGLGKISFVGIGNTEAKLITADAKQSFISLAGILGLNIRTPRTYEHQFQEQDIFVLYSDGIISNWQYEYDSWNQDPQQIAEEILMKYSRDTDDATIIIIKNASSIG